jgi:cytochrome P450
VTAVARSLPTDPAVPIADDDPIDLLDPIHVADPAALFRRMRERDPIAWSARHRAWVITGHPELDAAFRDRRLSTERMDAFKARQTGSRAEALAAAIELLEGWMLFHEPPTHTRLRAPLNRQFTPRAVARLAADVTELTDRLLDDLDAASGGDLVEAFTHPLPAAVIGRLFGVPDGEGRWLAEWSEMFGAVVFGAVDLPDYEDRARAAGAEFHDRLGPLLDRYRREPEDNLLSLLLATENRDDGLSTVEIVGACSLLLFAGHDTTASHLGTATLALLDDRAAGAAFSALAAAIGPDGDPTVDAALGTAIEELLRFEAPAKAMMRIVAEEHEREGHRFERGQAVFMAILGANRDPRLFDDAERLVLEREPNPHLTFGHGHHFCLGAALARLESRVALHRLFSRFPDLRVDGEVEWKPTISDRSARRIPVRTH